MKGGIASGVVYPTAIAELSQHYRFQSIGGTSAGAIAAAVTAAAEYQRRQTQSLAGFALLQGLPKELGEPVGPGKRKLLSLFQPQPALMRLYSVLIAGLNKGTTSSRVWHILMGFMKAYWQATVVAIFAGITAAVGIGVLYGKAFDPITIDVGLYALLSAAILFMLVFTITAAGLIGCWVYP